MGGQLYRQGAAEDPANVVCALPFVLGSTAALLGAIAVYATWERRYDRCSVNSRQLGTDQQPVTWPILAAWRAAA